MSRSRRHGSHVLAVHAGGRGNRERRLSTAHRCVHLLTLGLWEEAGGGRVMVEGLEVKVESVAHGGYALHLEELVEVVIGGRLQVLVLVIPPGRAHGGHGSLVNHWRRQGRGRSTSGRGPSLIGPTCQEAGNARSVPLRSMYGRYGGFRFVVGEAESER